MTKGKETKRCCGPSAAASVVEPSLASLIQMEAHLDPEDCEPSE